MGIPRIKKFLRWEIKVASAHGHIDLRQQLRDRDEKKQVKISFRYRISWNIESSSYILPKKEKILTFDIMIR